jgi:predicted amidophosphoribosyltransferase
MTPEQPIARLKVPLTGDQLELSLCEACGQPLPNRPLVCAHCGELMTEDDVSYYIDAGKFCLKLECQRAARRSWS